MRLTHLLSFFLLTAGFAVAADKWTVEDVLLQERGGALEISRDGKLAVYTKGRMDREKGEAFSNIYMKPLAGGPEITLTRGTDNNNSPRFSPDGARIAFLSNRRPSGGPGAGGGSGAPGSAGGDGPSGPQVWLIDTRGGEPWQLTKLEKGVRTFDWSDNDTLILAASEDSTYYAQRVKERKDTSQVIDDEAHEPPVRLFRFAVKDSKATRLTTNTDRISSLWVSPDGAWAVTRHNRSLAETFNQKIKSIVCLTDLKTGASKQLFADGKLLASSISWRDDSKGFYFSAPYTTHPYLYNAAISLLYDYDIASGAHAKIDLGWENGLAGSFGGAGFAVTPDGFITLLANGARNKPARYTRSGATYTRAFLEGAEVDNIHSVTLTEDAKTAIYTFSTSSNPPVLMLAKLEGPKLEDPKPFVEFNSAFKKKPIAKTEVISWKGANDDPIEGILYYPHNYEPGKKYPLVVMIHGGPHGHDAYAFNESMAYPHQLMAQRGAFILKPNYHGSSNYGLKFGESISGGKYNELEWIDVEKGVDSLIAKGLVDPDMLGVMGWSNGSIIAIELTTRTTRYKVAGAGAGDVNWISDWGNAVFGDSFEQYYLGKTPMDDPALYIRKSPLFRMDKVRTPTIIFFGTEDKQVPTEQGWQHYRALQHYGNTDVKFILFPGEAHGPRKLVHQRRKLEEELAWFDKYLFRTLPDTNEALKPDSPLSAALKLSRNASAPDAADRGKFAVSRFEITRAQYQQFDPSYSYAPGTGNYPATGVPFEKAQAYAAWLAQKTGDKWRLGTEEELGGMLTASKSENTLDLWAAYNVNPDDAARLASLIEGLGAGALLKPVGSFPGAGDDPVFDLGGNAAEWVVTKDGKGKALGGSADRPADPKAQATPRPDYTGFRVVRDAN